MKASIWLQIWLAAFLPWFLAGSGRGWSQTVEMHSSAGHDAVREKGGESFPAGREVKAAMTLQMMQADAAQGGAVWLEFTAKHGARGDEVLLRVPLASTGDAYGESHECKVGAGGRRALTFTAGLDEMNYVPFAAAGKTKDIDLLLNKYLCRAMAAPFDCAGEKVALPEQWDGWRLAGLARLRMTSGAPAVLKTSPVVIVETDTRFDRAMCARVAPSNGVCCVQGKTTNWHCGGRPTGEGWQQVSGDCWHQTTAGICKE